MQIARDERGKVLTERASQTTDQMAGNKEADTASPIEQKSLVGMQTNLKELLGPSLTAELESLAGGSGVSSELRSALADLVFVEPSNASDSTPSETTAVTPETPPPEYCVYILLDAATQHTLDASKAPKWILILTVPPSLTHIFQPADQTIISNLKSKCNKFYFEWISEMAATLLEEVAAQVIAGKIPPPGETEGGVAVWGKLPYKRYLKYRGLAGAVAALSRESIVRS